MQGDLPHTLYAPRKKRESDAGKVTDKVLQKQMEANRRAQERREAQQKARGEGYTMEEIFRQ